MTREDGQFPSVGGEGIIHTIVWLPEGEVRAVLQIVHGMQEYAARYEETAAWFCERGYAVCAHDQLGHGESLIGGKFGYFGEKDTTDTLAGDVIEMKKRMKKRFPGVPYFLFGHSMGSFVVRYALTKDSKGLSGAILCGTAGPTKGVSVGKLYLKKLWKKNGAAYTDAALAARIPTAYDQRFLAEKTKNAWLTREKEVCDRFNRDPLTQFSFSVSALWTLLDLLDRVSQKKWPAQLPKTLPILLTAGANDPVGAYGEGVRTLYDRMMQRKFDDLEIFLYPDCRHELHNETNREEILSDWFSWMENHR